MSLYMNVIHQRPMCGALWCKTKLLVLSFLKKLLWKYFGHVGELCFSQCPCGNSLPVRWWTTLYSRHVRPFLVVGWIGRRGTHIHSPPPSPPFYRLDSVAFLFLGFCKRHFLSWKSAKYEFCDNRQSCSVCYQWNACQYQKLNIVLMCFVPLMAPYWDLVST
jgi:hypothetical protein